MWLQEPERYEFVNFFEQFEGRELSELIQSAGGVRSDGKTLMAQPHVNTTGLWTLDDIKKINLTIPDPMKILNWQPTQ